MRDANGTYSNLGGSRSGGTGGRGTGGRGSGSEHTPEGKLNVAFGEFPRLSSLTMKYEDGGCASYDFGSTGRLSRGRRVMSTDPLQDREIAKAAVELLRSPDFVKETMKGFQQKKYNVSQKEIKNFAENIEKQYGLRERGQDSSFLSKLMG